MPIGRLHVITPTERGRDLLALATAAAEGGADVVQVRAKDLTDHEPYELVCRVRDVCTPRGVTCLVNDRIHVAVAAGVDGGHVGDHDLPVAAARRVLGSTAILGATARDPATGLAHERDGASY